jgi:hypothetical protein
MPIRFASEGYWGAVHFHFNGSTAADPPDMAHLKVYETQVVGGHGKLKKIARGGALAQACLVKIRSGKVEL